MKETYEIVLMRARDLSGIDLTYSRTKRFEIVRVRAAVINILWRQYNMPKLVISNFMGMNHSTIIHHTQAHPHRYRHEASYADLYDALCAQFFDESRINLDNMIARMRACMTVTNQ